MLAQANQLGIDVQHEFLTHPKGKRVTFTTGPLFVVMALARKDAVAAFGQWVRTNPADTEAMRKLQNDVDRYFDLVRYVRNIFEQGDEAHKRLTTEDTEELREHVSLADTGDNG